MDTEPSNFFQHFEGIKHTHFQGRCVVSLEGSLSVPTIPPVLTVPGETPQVHPSPPFAPLRRYFDSFHLLIDACYNSAEVPWLKLLSMLILMHVDFDSCHDEWLDGNGFLDATTHGYYFLMISIMHFFWFWSSHRCLKCLNNLIAVIKLIYDIINGFVCFFRVIHNCLQLCMQLTFAKCLRQSLPLLTYVMTLITFWSATGIYLVESRSHLA